jgi:hypothetical protein
MPNPTQRFPLWPTLIFVAAAPRLLAAFLLPNAFGDAGVYVRDIGAMSDKLVAGAFARNDLYGFWLPLYQLLCAVVCVVTGHPFYVAKVVAALFGTGVCLLVYALSRRLNVPQNAAWAAFALMALSPTHIFNSASSMTDVPHAFFVVASLFFVWQRRWLTASLLAALAGLTRVDGWLLAALIPALQLLTERRVSPFSVVVLLLPPAFWFYLSWHATGDWRACFAARQQYMDWLLSVNPHLATFAPPLVAQNTGALLLSVNLAVLAACVFAVWRLARRRAEHFHELASASLFFFAFLGFLVAAYLTHKQPIIFPRYGLLNFALGLPALPWAFVKFTQDRPTQARRLSIAVVAVCVLNTIIQLGHSIYILKVGG